MNASRQGNGDEDSGWCLGYVTCPQDAAKGFLGALLLTDERTRPLHFGYVAPIRPTLMQRILYGKTLELHAKVDVILQRLSRDGLGRVPDVVFVDSEELLAAREVFGVPTARLCRKPQTEQGVPFSTYQYDTGGNVNDADAVGRVVARLEQTVDLLDPFDRMREALKEALKETQK